MTSKTNLNSTPEIQFTSECANNLDDCICLTELHFVTLEVDTYTGDDWLPLCPDIDEGEIYRDWFVWFDHETTQEWEAYDYLTEHWFTAPDLDLIKAKIDQIEQERDGSFAAA